MKFSIGQRVKYRSVGEYTGVRECTGVIVSFYPGHGEYEDIDTGETYSCPDHYGVKVDSIPQWWAYPDTDRFAPEEADLSLA